MIIKYFFLLGLMLIIASPALAGTLIITAQERGHDQVLRLTHVHVADYGWNSTGNFIVRFENGEQQSLGQRSQWEYFHPVFVDDEDQLLK